eukprot:CAMPEP_0119338420 /NCGR_PEP_ID=MMETSP1333-20130426/95982_1 /TAXON_ID=418940 /ORGANISM="Scyphosphaera apsteinii, Strain RCC1455" /LENGTH=42 /DNA_ID= /DNA_START= /DNA_END= /DNA_ORIENTATION=
MTSLEFCAIRPSCCTYVVPSRCAIALLPPSEAIASAIERMPP